jgi:cGMP-dependent 3',5'-cyclic phosphodiesterase
LGKSIEFSNFKLISFQELVYTEFFAQGDLERQMGLKPNLMMDRQKACIPALQIEFLQHVVEPTFEILLKVFPETSKFLETMAANRRQWETLTSNVIKF